MYLTNFKNKEDIEGAYNCTLPESAEILLAWYGYGDYSGDSFVLYKHEGKLYEVNGSHCSCNGLEGQWNPEETTIETLKHIAKEGTKFSGYEGSNDAQLALEEVLKKLETPDPR